MKTYIEDAITDIKNWTNSFTEKLCDGLRDINTAIAQAVDGNELIGWIKENVKNEQLRKDIVEKIKEMQGQELKG